MPLIASTGLRDKAKIAELKALKVECLQKPYHPDVLLRIIHAVLHPAAVEPPLMPQPSTA